MDIRGDKMTREDVCGILGTQKLMSIGTMGRDYPDNSVVCFSFDNDCNLYFGSYSDTLKCKNIAYNNHVAITTGTLQIHGIAGAVEYGSKAYKAGRENYDRRFSKYTELFEREGNE